MTSGKILLTAATAVLAATAAQAQTKEITVAYFLEWPLPFERAKVEGTFDKELGVKVNWRAFDTGVAMSAAMAAGDVQIALSQGVPPLVTAVSAGQDLKIIDISVSYSDNDNCVVRSDLEIDKTNAKDLNGTRVGVPLGTAAHYGFLKQVEHFGIDASTLQIVDMAPPEASAAFAQGNLDWVCGWGGSLQRNLEHGNVLLSGPEKEAIGLKVFDVISTPGAFAAAEPELLTSFLKVLSAENATYAKDPAAFVPVLAKDAGMDVAATQSTLDAFSFLPAATTLSADWLGGGVQAYLKDVADFFVTTGNIPKSLDSYDDVIDTSFLEAATKSN